MRWNFAYVLLAAVILFPSFAIAQTDPCNTTFATCLANCPISGWGRMISVHADAFECFRFYRKYCGQNQWTLIYEGPNNSFCDCGYDPNGHQMYRVERYWDEDSEVCSNLYDSCESTWQPSACEP